MMTSLTGVEEKEKEKETMEAEEKETMEAEEKEKEKAEEKATKTTILD